MKFATLMSLCAALTFSTLTLSACASGPTAYGPAQSQGGLGFTNQQIESDRFTVSFTGRSAEEAHNYALRRAAEIAAAHNFQSFQVLGDRSYGDQRQGSPISTSVGVGIGNGGRYHSGSHTNVGIGIGINDFGRMLQGDKVTDSMEILLSNRPSNGKSNIYNAQSVLDSITPQIEGG